MRTLRAEEISSNMEVALKLVSELGSERSSAVRDMLTDESLDFFMAPASARVEHHCCFPGGLCHHSLNVAKFTLRIANDLGGWPREQLLFVSLLHDLGKCGDGRERHFIEQTSEWHRSKGMMYVCNPRCTYMPAQERTLFLLQSYGIELTPEEYVAIRVHDGMSLDENRPYSMREPRLGLILHWADRWAVEVEKDEFGDGQMSE